MCTSEFLCMYVLHVQKLDIIIYTSNVHMCMYVYAFICVCAATTAFYRRNACVYLYMCVMCAYACVCVMYMCMSVYLRFNNYSLYKKVCVSVCTCMCVICLRDYVYVCVSVCACVCVMCTSEFVMCA